MTLKIMNLRTHAALSLLFGLGLIWCPRGFGPEPSGRRPEKRNCRPFVLPVMAWTRLRRKVAGPLANGGALSR